MIKYFTNRNPKIEVIENGDFSEDKIFWVDLISPSSEEIHRVENHFGIEMFTEQESEEIESSSKYQETEDEIGINLNFMSKQKDEFIFEPVSFILKHKILYTERDSEYKTFQRTYGKLRRAKPEDGDDAFLLILDTRIDFLADTIEEITEKIAEISGELVRKENFNSDLLYEITSLQEQLLGIRENTIEIQRLLSSLIKSKLFPNEDHETVRIMLKDLSSILEYNSFCFDRLEFLQNTFQGLVDMEQNRIMKVFTIITVLFAPATLIAGIYGMNFAQMEGVNHPYGFYFALLFMVLSMAFTLILFKYKKWL